MMKQYVMALTVLSTFSASAMEHDSTETTVIVWNDLYRDSSVSCPVPLIKINGRVVPSGDLEVVDLKGSKFNLELFDGSKGILLAAYVCRVNKPVLHLKKYSTTSAGCHIDMGDDAQLVRASA